MRLLLKRFIDGGGEGIKNTTRLAMHDIPKANSFFID
jgi:hypothetical protein